MKKILLALIGFMLFFSCSHEASFLPKDHPVIETQHVTDINEEGVTLNGEFLTKGNAEISEYGFVYSPYDPNLENSNCVILEHNLEDNMYKETIHEGIATNIEYNVKTFAKTDTYTIYGNSVSFISKGSLYNPWNLIYEPLMDGWHDAHGISSDELGFILFQSESFYAFDPKNNALCRKQNIPMDGNTGTFYASFTIDNNLYVLSNDARNLFKYEIESDQWEILGERPSIPLDAKPILGFSIHNIGYFQFRRQLYSYDTALDRWTSLDLVPFENIATSVEVINDVAYFVCNNSETWSFNPLSGSWSELESFPGTWNGKLVSFTQDDSMFCGLGYFGSYAGAPDPSCDFWQFIPDSNRWKRVPDFPLLHTQNEVFTFSVGALSYFGYWDPQYSMNNNGYLLFRFDKNKIK